MGSRGKRGFYGIGRVVAELAHVLASTSCQAFNQTVEPVEINSPQLAPFNFSGFLMYSRLHRRFFTATLDSSSAADLDSLVIRIDRKTSVASLGPGFLVSAARPRLMARYGRGLRNQHLQLVPIIHDLFPLIDEHDKPSFIFKSRFLRHNKWIMANASLVISNSYFTADTLRDCFQRGLLPILPPVSVLPLAHEFGLSCRSRSEAYMDIQPVKGMVVLPEMMSYVLLVGPRLGRRNLQAVLEALTLLHASGRPFPKVVLAGAKRKSTSRALASKAFCSVRQSVVELPTPSQDDLKRLYSGALALVMPSYIEGWGLPAAEALWLGTPVLAADIPVMHEVCGPLARYFPPDKPALLANLLADLLADPQGRLDWVASVISAKSRLRSWHQVGCELNEILNRFFTPPDSGSG